MAGQLALVGSCRRKQERKELKAVKIGLIMHATYPGMDIHDLIHYVAIVTHPHPALRSRGPRKLVTNNCLSSEDEVIAERGSFHECRALFNYAGTVFR